MLSRRVWGSVLSSVVAAALVVSMVEPAGAAEVVDPSSGDSGGVISTASVPSTVPTFTLPVPSLQEGDFSEVIPGLEDDPVAASAPAAGGGAPSGPLTGSDPVGVEVSRDEFSVTRAVGDSFIQELSALPLSVAGANGEWIPIGTDFVASGDGSLSVSDNPLNPSVVDTASGTGVLSVSRGEVSLSTQLLGALDSSVAVGAVDGVQAAVFDSAVPNGDVEISAGINWVKENVVLAGPGSASTWSWRVHVTGLSLSKMPGGEVVASDASGVEQFRFEVPLAWDSSEDGTPIPLSVALVPLTASTYVLSVSAPREWLSSPDRVYPVVIDPSLVATYGDSTVTAYKSDGATRTDGVHVGNSRDASTNKYWRSIVSYNLSGLAGKQVLAAQFGATYANYGTTSNLAGSVSTTTCNGYSCVGTKLVTFTVGSGTGLSNVADRDLAATLSSWVAAGAATKKLMVRGDESAGQYTYKMLNTTLYVSYKDVPSITATLPSSTGTTTTGPTIEADATDPMGTGLQYFFEIFGSTNTPSGPQVDLTNVVASSNWIEDDNYIPAPGALSPGTYFYRVQVRDKFDRDYLQSIQDFSAPYFDTTSAATSAVTRFTVAPEVTQPSQQLVSIQPGDVITDYTPTISVPIPASTLPITGFAVSVTSNPDGLSGNVATSGVIDLAPGATTASWQVPAGTLHDGGQYYVTVRTAGTNGLSYPAWVTDFTLNRRLGFDSPSPMEDIGALGVNLASGNVTASISTPEVMTAGGPIGFTFNYNSHDESNRGLTASYYDTSSVSDMSTWTTSGHNAVLVRRDSAINFSLASGESPAPGIGAEKYAVHWEGLITLPAGHYLFGMKHNNGAKVTIANTFTPVNSWNDTVKVKTVDFVRSQSVTFAAGVPQEISVDFYQTTSRMQAVLYVADYVASGTPKWKAVTADAFSVKNEILPVGWSMSSFLAGAQARYASVDVLDSAVVLKDTSGGTHTYKKLSDGGFEPPRGEYGVISMTDVGTVTLTEDDGTVYQFRPDGRLETVTAPGDAKQPAQPIIKFDVNGRVETVSDPLSATTVGGTLNRYVKFTYSDGGTTLCNNGATIGQAPAGMLCKIEYSSNNQQGPMTYIEYAGGAIVSITNPGGEKYSLTYAGTTTESVPLLTELVTPYGNDLRASSGAYPSSQSTPNITYVLTGDSTKPKEATLPQLAGLTAQILDFVWGDGTTTTQLRSTPTLKQTVTFDRSWRETSTTSAMGYSTVKKWGAYDALTRVTDSATGLTTARRFDSDGRVTDVYGPAPSTCFTTSEPVSVLPSCPITPGHQHTDYDTTIHGLASTQFTNNAFTGTPIGFGTVLDTLVTVGTDSNGQPVTGTGIVVAAQTVTGADSGSASRLTGLITFPTVGDWWVKATTNQSATLTISDIRQAKVLAANPAVIADANSAPITVTGDGSSVTASHRFRQRIRLDVGYLNATGTTTSLWWKNGPTAPWEPVPSSALSPDYGLTTSTQTDDSATGVFANNVHNVVTNYGYTHPWLGQVTSTSSGDGTNMLSSTATFEDPTVAGSLNRLTATTMPSGAAETYAYYPANATAGSAPSSGASICNVSSSTPIGGLLKSRTDSAGIVTYYLYDLWGRTVGTKTNGDATWSCTTYDSRGRTTKVTTSGFGTWGNYTNLITTTTTFANYGDPRNTKITDGTHAITTKMDTLGRLVSTTDSLGTVTTTQYDPVTGRLNSSTSTTSSGAAQTVSYTYDLDGKVLTTSRNGTIQATAHYDAATARVTGVTYANGMATGFGYGPTGTVDTKTYTTANGTYTENVTRSQSGRIVADTFTDPTGTSDPTTYSYDSFGRLTSAELSDQTFTYGFDTVAGCGVANAGLNSNRTSQTRTINGVSTTDTYCYTAGDRLTSASQVNGSITYDLHGNIVTMGDVSFTYDSLDRHVSTTLPNGSTITLERDIDGAILTRTVTGNAPEIVKYSTGVVQFYLSATKSVTGTTLTLPGGMSVTDSTGPQTATFTSLQGNACVTSSAAGTTRTRFDPFGTPLTALPDTRPGTAKAGFGDVAGVLTDTISPYGLIDMGARLYSTILGRFLQVDPVPGGGVNAYVYPPDPVNTNDYSGESVESDIAWAILGTAAMIACTSCTLLGIALLGALSGFGAYMSDTAGTNRSLSGALIAGTLGAFSGVGGIGVGKGATIALGRSSRFGVNSARFGHAGVGRPRYPTQPGESGKIWSGGTLNNKGVIGKRVGWRTVNVPGRGTYTYFGTSTGKQHSSYTPMISSRWFE